MVCPDGYVFFGGKLSDTVVYSGSIILKRKYDVKHNERQTR